MIFTKSFKMKRKKKGKRRKGMENKGEKEGKKKGRKIGREGGREEGINGRRDGEGREAREERTGLTAPALPLGKGLPEGPRQAGRGRSRARSTGNLCRGEPGL